MSEKDKTVELVAKLRDDTAKGLSGISEKIKNLGQKMTGMSKEAKEAAVRSNRLMGMMHALSAAAGVAGGKFGAVIEGFRGIIAGAMSFGPAGAAVSASILAINFACQQFIERAEKARDRVLEWADALKTRLASIRAEIFETLARQIDDVAKATERSARSFERAAAARERFQARLATAHGIRNEGELGAMRLDAIRAVGAASDEDKARVQAEWNLKIAQRQVDMAIEAARLAETAEKERISTLEKRLKLEDEAVEKAGEQVQKAREALRLAKDADSADVEKYEELVKETEKRFYEAQGKADVTHESLGEARQDAIVAEDRRQQDIQNAKNAAQAAESALIAVHQKAIEERNEFEREAERKMLEEMEQTKKKAARKETQDKIKEIEKEKKARFEAIDAEIEKERKAALEWEQNAQRARTGATFGKWARDERDIERNEARQEKKRKNAVDNAQAELDRLVDQQKTQGKAFNLRAFSPRMEKLKEFINAQNQANNPAAQNMKKLEEEKKTLIEQTNTKLDEIKTVLEAKLEL